MNALRLPTSAALIVASALVTGGCATAPVDLQGSKQDSEQVLQLVFNVAGSEWSDRERNSSPADAECTANGDPHGGEQYHWHALGSAPSDPKAYIESIVNTLRDHERTVTVRATHFGKYGTLYQAVADEEDKPMVAVTANTRTTSVTVESACVPTTR